MQLRDRILTGDLTPGERLPNEARLAEQLGISRATLREALRALTAQRLITTVKGAAGGSFVTLPTVPEIADLLSGAIELLGRSREISLEEFLEARELLEVPAARLAAARRRQLDLRRLRESIPSKPNELGVREQYACNRAFHVHVLESAGNTLLFIAAQPVFAVLETYLARSRLPRSFGRAMTEHHHRIAAAIDAGDGDTAAGEMHSHLEYLRPYYEKAWRASA